MEKITREQAGAVYRKRGIKVAYMESEQYPEILASISVSKRIIVKNTKAAPDAKIIVFLPIEEAGKAKEKAGGYKG